MPPIAPLPLTPGPHLREAFPRLRTMLEGTGPLLLPHAVGDRALPDLADCAPPAPGSAAWPAGVAVGTSGSTGRPKRAILPHGALRASAHATHEVLGGPGRWLLTLPPHHIAGLQVVLRSLVAGVEPAWGATGPFTAAGFVEDVRTAARAGTPCRYLSLVPTQLTRLLADPDGSSALAGFDAVLVGGAAAGSELLARARERGVRVVTTYGMSETAGGCVYDGLPLPGVRVEVRTEVEDSPAGSTPAQPQAPGGSPGRAPQGTVGRIHLGGPVVALGYLPDLQAPPDPPPFTQEGGVRWFRTDDLGALQTQRGLEGLAGREENTLGAPGRGADDRRDEGGQHGHDARRREQVRLRVLGRIDDVIVTGGLKVAPRVVEEAVADVWPGRECVAFAVPDEEWGQVVALALTAPPPEHERLRASWPQTLGRLRAGLPAHALPRRLLALTELPLRGPGKPDRDALRALAATAEVSPASDAGRAASGPVGECENGRPTKEE